jgi:hypothetical protein
VERRLRAERPLHSSVSPTAGALDLAQWRIPIADIAPSSLAKWRDVLLEHMCAATGSVFSARQFRDNLPATQRLLQRRADLTSVPAPKDVDGLDCLAAMIIARDMTATPPSFEPRLHGKSHGRSASVKSALKNAAWETSEEFHRVFAYAMEWTRCALCGYGEALDARLAFEMRQIEAAETVLGTHDSEAVQTYLTNLDRYAKSGIRGVLQPQ